MMGLPNWLRNREGDYDLTHDEVPVPPTAKVELREKNHGALIPVDPGKKPLPFHIAPVDAPPNDEASVVVQAHQFIEQWKAKDVTQQKTIERLEAEKAELTSQLQSERRKSGLLELDIAERDNTIQTLQSDVLERRRLLDMLKDINDKTSAAFARLGVTGEPKKERKPNAKTPKAGKKESADREEASQPAAEDRPTAKEYHGA
jgi:hypothetical protein